MRLVFVNEGRAEPRLRYFLHEREPLFIPVLTGRLRPGRPKSRRGTFQIYMKKTCICASILSLCLKYQFPFCIRAKCPSVFCR
jgi:hypothetical protein